MNTSSEKKFEKPNVIRALISGFNTIANKPHLMILPIILDLFLWFGPAWRVDEYFRPLIQGIANLPMINSGNTGTGLDVENYFSIWQELISNLDLAITLRTFPIGVPSLMASKSPFINPLGASPIISLVNNGQVFGLFLLFLLIGFVLGNLYFNNISKQIIDLNKQAGYKPFLKSLLQVILMPLILVVLIFVVAIPFSLLAGLITLINPVFGEFFIFLAGLVILWILMPLIFTPHGIFLYRQNMIQAMITSINIVRASMGQTTWFVLLSFVLIQGMNYLWATPTVDNWFLSLGIFGHAFMVTAVITASFFYFIDATKYTQTLINQSVKVS
jgi:hypothetical protein